jgi:hypothetical protein
MTGETVSERTKGELKGYYCKDKDSKIEMPDGNINYLCITACKELNMAAEIANLRDSPFMKEKKHLNALHLMKCWNMHNKFTTFMTAIITNEEDNPTKAVVSIKARAKKLLKEAIK